MSNRLTRAIENRKNARLEAEAAQRRQAEERAVAQRREAELRRIRAEAKQIETAWDRVGRDIEDPDSFWDGLRAEANRNAGAILKMTEDGDSVTLSCDEFEASWPSEYELQFTVQKGVVYVTSNYRRSKDFGLFGPREGDEKWVEDPAIAALSDRFFPKVRAAFEAFVIAADDALPNRREVA